MDVQAGTTLRCARHPQVETSLRCSRCDKPICPRCMVMTPVGARCPDCARSRPHPLFDVGPVLYARAIAAALVIAIVGGTILQIVRPFASFGYFLLVMGLAYVAGGLVSRAANRKTGRGLQVVAGASVVLAFLGQQVFLFALRDPSVLLYPWIVGPLLVSSVVSFIANPIALLVLALAAWLAASRV